MDNENCEWQQTNAYQCLTKAECDNRARKYTKMVMGKINIFLSLVKFLGFFFQSPKTSTKEYVGKIPVPSLHVH